MNPVVDHNRHAAGATIVPTALQVATLNAGEASLLLVDLVRAAHSASCEAGGPMELLLREAIADARELSDRLVTLAQFAKEGR